MPEEIFIVLVVFILFVLAPAGVFRGIKSLRESGPRNRDDAREGSPMRRSDLQAMVDDAVIEATAPLVARIDELERELLLGEGEARISPEVLEEALGAPEEDEALSERRRQRDR
ncbi:MAG: hypothetical protein AAGI52_00795 [Bacteroidota bacterium]